MSHLLKFARKVFLVRGVRVLIVLALGLGSTLIYLLLQASSNTPLFAEGLPMFLGMGAGVTVALLLLIGYQLLKIRRRVRARVFGSKLTLRLVLLF